MLITKRNWPFLLPVTSVFNCIWVKFKLDQFAKVFYSDLFLSCLSLNNYNWYVLSLIVLITIEFYRTCYMAVWYTHQYSLDTDVRDGLGEAGADQCLTLVHDRAWWHHTVTVLSGRHQGPVTRGRYHKFRVLQNIYHVTKKDSLWTIKFVT